LKVRSSPSVKYVEPDQMMYAFQDSCSLEDSSWNLARISQQIYDDDTYRHKSAEGAGVDVYVIDTGIRITHSQFEGRAFWGANFVDTVSTDGNGHGTHVASTAVGKTYGISRKSNVYAVKVLGADGSGTNAGVIKGIDWVAARKGTRVANMSLGGGLSTATNNAVNNAVASGATFAVAAGNDNKDAKNYSPASAALAICVGATALTFSGTDSRASYSNWGTTVDILAPGSSIIGAWIFSDVDTKTISGTSMASPHVAGVAAAFLSDNPGAKPADVSDYLISNSNDGRISMDCSSIACSNTPNRLLLRECGISPKRIQSTY